MRLPSLVGIALAALVAGAAALVHAEQGADNKHATAPEVLYDLNALPDPVKAMLHQIGDAAATGEIEKMRPVLESNELKPMVAAAYIDDPIGHWKKESADGTGRDVLAKPGQRKGDAEDENDQGERSADTFLRGHGRDAEPY